MQRFKLIKNPDTAIGNWFASKYNAWMHKLSRKSAEKMCKYKNKAIYGIELHGVIHVMTSIERDDINSTRPKGNKMNIAQMLKYQTFLITPELLKAKEQERIDRKHKK